MKSKRNGRKGFTLIELIITIGIISIVMSSIFLFFFTNVNNYKKLKTDTELQFQTQYIMNFISNKVMESMNVELIRTDRKSVINGTDEYSITKISLRYGVNDNNFYIFEVNSNNKIFYGNRLYNDSANSELGTYVKELRVAPYPYGKTFAQCNALRLTLCLAKNGQEYEAEQIVFMRNN